MYIPVLRSVTETETRVTDIKPLEPECEDKPKCNYEYYNTIQMK
jgi:hypothetical protein